MTILIRTELKKKNGIGHFMRMLSLAKWLNIYGQKFQFFVECHSNENAFYSQRLTQIERFSGSKPTVLFLLDDEHLWERALKKADKVILDSYQFSQEWIDQLKKTHMVVLLDDNPDVQRDAQAIVDSTLNGERQVSGIGFIGQQYFLASPELFERHMLRARSLLSQKCYTTRSVFIGFGGTDIKQLIPKTIDALCSWGTSCTHLIIAVAREVAHFGNIVHALKRWEGSYEFVSDYQDVIKALGKSDIAIGASGGMVFERAMLGVPSIVVQVAENQKAIFSQIFSAQLAQTVTLDVFSRVDTFDSIFRRYVCDTHLVIKHLRNGLNLTVGLGASWLAQWLTRGNYNNVYLAPPDEQFKEDLFSWQSDSSVRQYSRNSHSPSWIEHCQWYRRFQQNPLAILAAVKLEGGNIGMVRLQPQSDFPDGFEVSIIVDPKMQKKGLGLVALNRLRQLVPFFNFYAYISSKNSASIRLFEKAGYKPIKEGWYIQASSSVKPATRIERAL